jgi:hypothetical protein
MKKRKQPKKEPVMSHMDRRKIDEAVKHAKLIEKSRREARIVKHEDPSPQIIRKRKALEKDMSAWLMFFGKDSFSDNWSPDHLKILAKTETAINDGGCFAEAMPRGSGKSTIAKWVVIYATLTGRRKYVVSIAATAELAQGIVDFVRSQIMENDRLHEFYPHVTTYARKTDGKAIKARFQLRADGKLSGIMWSKNTLVLPEVLSADKKDYPSNGAILEAHGLTGAIRGKWRDTKTGKVLRPDFVVLDDPQSRESAESVSQCDMRERIITGDVLGLAGPRKKIAAVMPCTIIRRGDLAARFLDHKTHPEWQGETCAMVNKWPDAQETLWKEYANIYKEDEEAGGGMKKATEFYLANRAAMDQGAEVSWNERIRDGEVSAIQTAENLLLESGPQFWAEYQNKPLELIASQYELTVEMILRHTVTTPRLTLPHGATVFSGHCDINRSGLHWCLSAFDQTMTGHCVAYGKHPQHGDLWAENAPILERRQTIFRGLKTLCDSFALTNFTGRRLGLLLIDLGYEREVVMQFCRQARYPFRVVPSGGRASHKYYVNKAKLVTKPFEGCHVERAADGSGDYLIFNADQWRETAQRAFLAEPGAPGGYTLHAVEDVRQHKSFAEHLVAEKLSNKYETDQGLRWEWRHVPGSQWDWGDAYTGSWVAAAACGLSAGGVIVAPRKYVEKRKSKITEAL